MSLVTCLRCQKDAVRSIGFNKPYCAEHYVAEEEDRHLHAYIAKFYNAEDPIIQEIIRQKPEIYEKRFGPVRDSD